eukprot:jgi/Orpsp1_1/1178135/evm.model.c7180000064182.1
MGLYNKEITINEIIAIIIHNLSLISLALIIYLTHNKNRLITYFAIANIGQHLSKLFRLVIFDFKMTNSPLWSCYFHAFTNFLTVGMESYIEFLFSLHLWVLITKKNSFKSCLFRNMKTLTYIFGFGLPFLLSLFSILPQIIQGKKFVIPPNAENCITGYRQNPWQIILSGPGTTLPPFLLSSGFAMNIVYVIYSVSTKKIMNNIKKFSTISYSSWIRMLWFGLVSSLVVVVNVIGDFKNAIAMYKYGTPEPGIKTISIPYFITAGVGIFTLLIFGTTPESKRKISRLMNSSFSYSISSSKNNKSYSHSQSYTNNYSQSQSFNHNHSQSQSQSQSQSRSQILNHSQSQNFNKSHSQNSNISPISCQNTSYSPINLQNGSYSPISFQNCSCSPISSHSCSFSPISLQSNYSPISNYSSNTLVSPFYDSYSKDNKININNNNNYSNDANSVFINIDSNYSSELLKCQNNTNSTLPILNNTTEKSDILYKYKKTINNENNDFT